MKQLLSSQFMALSVWLDVNCLWMNLENLGQFLKCDVWVALHLGQEFGNFHLSMGIQKEGGTGLGL